VVAYQFLWFGGASEIKVVFDANGVATSVIPSFDN
jgi:hypothetical protein